MFKLKIHIMVDAHHLCGSVCKAELMQTEAVTQTGAYRSHEGADLSFVRRHTAEVCKSESCSWRAAGGMLIFCDSCGDVRCSSGWTGCHFHAHMQTLPLSPPLQQSRSSQRTL